MSLVRIAAILPLLHATAHGAVLFADTFNRADSRNVDATLTGITNFPDTPLPADGVYTHAFIDPANQSPLYGVQDGVAANGGGAQIVGNQLQLAVGAGTSNAYVNHNFTDASILSGGGFSVTLAVLSIPQTTNAQGGGFALGMSQAEANSAGDAFDGASRMTGAFGNAIGATVPAASISDFWVALRGDNSLVWGGHSGTVQGVSGLAGKTGTISVNFALSSFDAGSTVSYEVFLDSVSKGTGSFTWSGGSENYIGLDARDSTGVNFDNFSVNTVPEPASAGLLLVGSLSLLRRRRR